MAIIEAGLIINGLPVVRREYLPTNSIGDPFLRTGLFSAIQTFASKAFSDIAEEMRLKKYILLIKNLDPMSKDQLTLYLVVERGADITEIRKRLDNIRKKIISKVILLTPSVISQDLSQIENLLDNELEDLCLKPADRAKKLFG